MLQNSQIDRYRPHRSAGFPYLFDLLAPPRVDAKTPRQRVLVSAGVAGKGKRSQPWPLASSGWTAILM